MRTLTISETREKGCDCCTYHIYKKSQTTIESYGLSSIPGYEDVKHSTLRHDAYHLCPFDACMAEEEFNGSSFKAYDKVLDKKWKKVEEYLFKEDYDGK